MTDVRVHIDKLAFGGSGVGHIEGKVCFVPLSCPGDELLVRITSEKRSYLTALIVAIVTPSPQRVTPPCKLFGSCGGCGWQHIAYSRQLAAKQQILAETLWRGARIPGERISDMIPSPVEFGYRNRVQFKLHNGTGRLQIGFYRHGSHFVEDVSQGCPIARPIINDAIGCLRDVLASFNEPDKIPQVNIDCGEQGVVAIINYIGRDAGRVASFFESRVSDLGPITSLYLQTGRKSTLRRLYGDGLLTYSLPGASPEAPPCILSYPPGGFSQVNTPQNRVILELVRKLAVFSGRERVLDLYCGNGNFSLPLAGEAGHITGIEENEMSVAAARGNCRMNGIDNAEYLVSEAARGVRSLADTGRRFDVVILDPPRSGAPETVVELSRLNPEQIVYISCDPSTLARDCGILSGKGYRVVSSTPVDMFPQTYHLESVTLLQRGI